jgi:hypothetical protein
MEIKEAFGRAVNHSITKDLDSSLKVLGLDSAKVEELVKKKNFLVPQKSFDIVLDYKPNLNQINIYLTEKKWSKKLLESLKKSSNFKSMMILLGNLIINKKLFQIRLGAFGVSSSDLVKAVIKFKK